MRRGPTSDSCAPTTRTRPTPVRTCSWSPTAWAGTRAATSRRSVAVAAFAPLDGESHGPDDALDQLETALADARDEIIARSDADPELAGMGTTVLAILRAGNKLAMVHLGDSRGYLMRDGVLTQVTTDHTFVQHLVDIGRITPEEAEHHPQRSVVMRVLGDFDPEVTPDLSVREARPGDRWLLCSDGPTGDQGLPGLGANDATDVWYPDQNNDYVHLGPVVITGANITSATASLSGSNQSIAEWVIDFVLDSEGTAAFATATREAVNAQPPKNQIAIAVDHKIISNPVVQSPITAGRGQITGNFTEETAKNLAAILNAGSLPVNLTQQSVQTVSPTLGTESLKEGIIAGAAGLILLFLYLLFYYRLLGIVAWFGMTIWAIRRSP